MTFCIRCGVPDCTRHGPPTEAQIREIESQIKALRYIEAGLVRTIGTIRQRLDDLIRRLPPGRR